jgi:hypothetical protein
MRRPHQLRLWSGERNLYRALPYPTVPYRTLPYYSVPYRTLPYSTVLYRTLPSSSVLFRTLPYSTVLYRTLLYSTVPIAPQLLPRFTVLLVLFWAKRYSNAYIPIRIFARARPLPYHAILCAALPETFASIGLGVRKVLYCVLRFPRPLQV